jgi:hypothetical protein
MKRQELGIRAGQNRGGTAYSFGTVYYNDHKSRKIAVSPASGMETSGESWLVAEESMRLGF